MKLSESKLRNIIREELSRLSEAVQPDFFHEVASEMERHPEVNVKKAEYATPGPVSGTPSIHFELQGKRGDFTASFKDRAPYALITVNGPMLREKFEVPQPTADRSSIVDKIVKLAGKA